MSADSGQNVVDNWEDDPDQAVQMVEQKMKQVKILKRNEEDRKAMALKNMQEDEARRELEQQEKEKRAAMGISHADEASTADEVPLQVKLLRRPNGAGTFNPPNGKKPEEARPRKTLEERQAAYDEARNRILGENYKPEEDTVSAPVVETSRSRSKSPEIIRVPRNPPPLMNQPVPSLMNSVFVPPVVPIHPQHAPPFYPLIQTSQTPPFPPVQSNFPGISAFASPPHSEFVDRSKINGSTSPPQEYTTRFDDFIASQGTGRPLVYFDPSRPPPPLLSQVNPRMLQEGRQTIFYTGSMAQGPQRVMHRENQQIANQAFRPATQPMFYSDQLQIKNLNSSTQSNNNSSKRKGKGKKSAMQESQDKN